MRNWSPKRTGAANELPDKETSGRTLDARGSYRCHWHVLPRHPRGRGRPGQGPELETTDTMIPSRDAGIELYVRKKHLAGRDMSSDRILLFVHGATYPAETAFDLPIEGVSMMDLIAQRGYDVCLVDVRGYGRSTRPPEMSQPPAAKTPIVSTAIAAHDLGAAVDDILERRSVSKINVMGWSWGTSIAGLYTSANNAKVSRLVLYAPQWI